jgi:hypothetical protein
MLTAAIFAVGYIFVLTFVFWLIKKKNVRFMFNQSLRSDFIFWLFVLLVVANIASAISNTMASGGIDTSIISVISGVLDFTLRIIVAYLYVLPILLIRKLIRRMRTNGKKDLV